MALPDDHNTVASLAKSVRTLAALLAQKEKKLARKRAYIENINHELLLREQAIRKIRCSLSYRLGRFFTWPLRMAYELTRLLYRVDVLMQLAIIFFRHPLRTIRNLNLANMKKLSHALSSEEFAFTRENIIRFLEQESAGSRDLVLFTRSSTSRKITFPNADNPLVSIIVPVYNQWKFTHRCLQAIKKHTENISYEIIIADDNSSDRTRNIRKYISNITVIRNETNLGFLRNCNHAAKAARGKYLLLLNNDTNVQPDWLKHLLDLAEADQAIGLVGAKLVYPDGRLQEAGGIIWQDAVGLNYGRMRDPASPEFNYVKEADYISGACILVRHELWKKIGGFDERYAPAYYEDTDLAFEIRKHGCKVVYQPQSVVVHFEGMSHGTDEQSGLKAYQVANREKFLSKWKTVLKKDHQKNASNIFSARDRSAHKKTIVVIDHYVPQFDKDAGSRMIYNYMQLFCEMGMNIKFIGDNFHKHEPYTSALQQMGVEVLYGPHYMCYWKQWIMKNKSKLDYFYIIRPHVAEKYMDFIKNNTRSKIIYFTCDLHHLRLQRYSEFEKCEKIIAEAEKWRKIEMNIFEKADSIQTPSTFEQKVISQSMITKKVTDIPLYLYENFMDPVSDFRDRKDLLFVGGFNHHPNRDGIVWFTKNIFPKVLQAIPNTKLNVIGSNPPNEIKNLASDNICIHGFVSDEVLKEFYAKTRLIIVPLRFGAGVKGKLLEAMYHGVPVVSTSTGIEGIRNIESLIDASDTEESFAERIIQLYGNDLELRELSKKYVEFMKNYASKGNARSLMWDSLGIDTEKSGHKQCTVEQFKNYLVVS